tara:strand:- start:841 stop:1041 length:201 start_codon:yes stop_codon:yes gene_type:complete
MFTFVCDVAFFTSLNLAHINLKRILLAFQNRPQVLVSHAPFFGNNSNNWTYNAKEYGKYQTVCQRI